MTTINSAISPSRAKDFQQCPLKFRYRVIDKLPEQKSLAMLRGTLVHSVLEYLFLVKPTQRTISAAQDLLLPRWEALLSESPEILESFTDAETVTEFLASARPLLESYFRLENPQFIAPQSREQYVNAVLPTGIAVRGIVDRIDAAPNGDLRVVDYKTGKAPHPNYMQEAVFQMIFYATVLYYERGILPKRTQLVYLGDEKVLTYDPTAKDVTNLTQQITQIWSEIKARIMAKHFEAKKSKLCNWCDFQKFCPEFAGISPEINEAGLTQLLTVEQATTPR